MNARLHVRTSHEAEGRGCGRGDTKMTYVDSEVDEVCQGLVLLGVEEAALLGNLRPPESVRSVVGMGIIGFDKQAPSLRLTRRRLPNDPPS